NVAPAPTRARRVPVGYHSDQRCGDSLGFHFDEVVMRTTVRSALVATIFAPGVPGAQALASASVPPAPAFPAIGDAAPDFTSTATDSTGKAMPVALSSLRGKVVVLAFYP